MLSLPSSPIVSDALPASRDYDLSRQGRFWRATFTAMGGPCELLCETAAAAEAESLARSVCTDAWRIEDKFSRYLDGNIVHRINAAAGAGIEVDEETASLLDFADELYTLSAGGFDITSGALRRVWTFDGGDRVPTSDDVLSVLEFVGWDKVRWDGRMLTMPAGMQIDFGGICKEYAVDKAIDRVRRQTAACLVNFGGDLAVTGPPAHQACWQVGREALQGPSASPAGLIRLETGALATSGNTRRFVLRDGVRYSHILNPATGWPVDGAPATITVAADTCVQAGVFCTLAMLQGAAAEAFLDAEGLQYWCARL